MPAFSGRRSFILRPSRMLRPSSDRFELHPQGPLPDRQGSPPGSGEPSPMLYRGRGATERTESNISIRVECDDSVRAHESRPNKIFEKDKFSAHMERQPRVQKRSLLLASVHALCSRRSTTWQPHQLAAFRLYGGTQQIYQTVPARMSRA
jgi:hypothetical protein